MIWTNIKLLSYALESDTNSEKVTFVLRVDHKLIEVSFSIISIGGFDESAKVMKGDEAANDLARHNREAYGFLEMTSRLLFKMPVDLSL